MKKRLIALILTFSFLTGMAVPALAADTRYTDVSSTAWYADAAAYCQEKGIMTGTSGSTFSPNTAMSRAMLATVLYRMAGSPAVTGGSTFTDVLPGSWYSDAVAWAHQTGITDGYGNGRFGTDDAVTREQFVTFLWRYADRPDSANGADFADAGQISTFAKNAVDWAHTTHIVAGKGNNRFDPKGHTTRAEAAQILMNFSQKGETTPGLPPSGDEPSILIAYFSWAGHTEQIAREIQAQAGGDLFEITPATPYTSDINELSGIALRELHENARPALGTHVEDMDQYDVVFVGYPCWWSNAPMPVFTFLEEYDFSGKKIIPFTSYGENVFGNSISSMEAILTNSEILEGLAIQEHSIDTAPERVSEWLQKLRG